MTVNVYEVPRERWADELNAFTLLCEGWLVSIDVFGYAHGETLEIRRLPLLGVSVDRVDHDSVVSISVAQSASGHLTHRVPLVRRIFVEVAVDGTTAGLLIESAERTRTVVELRAAAVPHGGFLRDQ